jgi:hypothetical protein
MSNTTIVADFYNKNAEIENNRLVDGRLEFAITLKTILDALPKGTSLRIADIGGGTGRYGTVKPVTYQSLILPVIQTLTFIPSHGVNQIGSQSDFE